MPSGSCVGVTSGDDDYFAAKIRNISRRLEGLCHVVIGPFEYVF